MTWHLSKNKLQRQGALSLSPTSVRRPSTDDRSVRAATGRHRVRQHARMCARTPLARPGRERQRSRKSPPPTIAESACSAVVAAAHIRAATFAHARAGFRCFSRSLLVRAQVLVRPGATHVHCQFMSVGVHEILACHSLSLSLYSSTLSQKMVGVGRGGPERGGRGTPFATIISSHFLSKKTQVDER